MIDLRVLQNDLTTEVAVLDVDSARHGLSWVDSVLDQGGANFEIPHTSPVVAANPTLFAEGNVIQIRDGGTPLFAFEVERPRRDAGNVSDRISVAGPGALALLDHALVQLATDQARLKNRQRVFGWMSTDFDDTAWDSPIPYSGGTQADPDRPNRTGRPVEWPDPNAEWLWSSGVDGSGNHPVGNSYFRWELDADTLGPGPYLLDIVGDNLFVAYFDGDQVADGTDWRGFATVEVELVAGVTHVLAVEVRNQRQSGGIMWTLAEFIDDEEERGDVVARTGDTPGRSLDYPADVPGVTHGFVLKTLFDEAQARGSLNAVSIDFDAAVDSDGVAWADEIEITLQAGNDSLLTAADRMRDWPVEFRMDPATFTFQAFQHAGVDRGQTPDGGLTTVTIPKGRAAGRSWEADGKIYDVLTVETQFDWGEVDGGAPPVTNRREGFLSLAQSPTLSLALKQAEKVRQLYATRREQVTFQTSSGTPGPQPYSEYGVGDVIEAPTLGEVTDGDWTSGDLRVDTITATLVSGGHVTWTHQAVDARIRSTLERLLTSREALGDGTLGGRTKVSTSPLSGGRSTIASTSRRGGGGEGGFPVTVLLEASDVTVPSGALFPLDVEFDTVVDDGGRERLLVVEVEPPVNEVVWPVSGTIQLYLEGEWDNFAGAAQVRAKLDGVPIWPRPGDARSPDDGGEYPSFGPAVSEGIPIAEGERLRVELQQFSGDAQVMKRIRFGAHQLEAADVELAPPFEADNERVVFVAQDGITAQTRIFDGDGNALPSGDQPGLPASGRFHGLPIARIGGRIYCISSAHVISSFALDDPGAGWQSDYEIPGASGSAPSSNYGAFSMPNGRIRCVLGAPSSDNLILTWNPATGAEEWRVLFDVFDVSQPLWSAHVAEQIRWTDAAGDNGSVGAAVIGVDDSATEVAFYNGTPMRGIVWIRDGLFLVQFGDDVRCIDLAGQFVDFGDLPFEGGQPRFLSRTRRRAYGNDWSMDIDTGEVTAISWEADGLGTGSLNASAIINESDTRAYTWTRTGSSPTFQHWVAAYDLDTQALLWVNSSGPIGANGRGWAGKL